MGRFNSPRFGSGDEIRVETPRPIRCVATGATASTELDFAAMPLEMVGVALALEMYDEDTVRRVDDRLGLDSQRTPDAVR